MYGIESALDRSSKSTSDLLRNRGMSEKLPRYETLILVGLFLAAFFLRVWGITFGFPYMYHGDEPMYTTRVIEILAGSNLRLTDFGYGGVLRITLGLVYWLWYMAGHLSGAFPSFADFKDWAFDNLSSIVLPGRLIAAWAGAVTCVVLYKAGRWTYGRREGLLAAILLAGVFLHVRDSHYAVADVPLVFLATVTFYLSIRILRRGQSRDYLLAGLSAGLTTATKHTGLLVILLPLLAHLLRSKAQGRPYREWLLARPLLAAYLAATLAFAIGMPYAWLDWPAALAGVNRLVTVRSQAAWGVKPDIAIGYLYYPISIGQGAGWLLSGLMLLGVGLALWRHKDEDILAMYTPLVFYGFLGYYKLGAARYILPVYPFLVLLAARCLVAAVAHSERRRLLLTSAAAVLLLWQPLANSVWCDYIFTQKDTRTLAKEWIETNIPPESILVVERWGNPPLYDLYHAPVKGEPAYWVYRIYSFGMDMENNLQVYLNEGAEYAVINNYNYDEVYEDPAIEQKRRHEYQLIERLGQLAKEITPYRGGYKPPVGYLAEQDGYTPLADVQYRDRPGPVIWIYKVPGKK
jgi:4-amino-4-deoxy-L-arabinose transferase-like glycosyltransferase